MSADNLIRLGGIFNLAFAVYHMCFWWVFGWKRDLASLSFANRQVMQILNLCLTFAFLIFSYVSLFHTVELLGTRLGRSLLLLISVFWFLRAIEQVIFFGLERGVSWWFFVAFLAGTLFYAYPWFVRRGL